MKNIFKKIIIVGTILISLPLIAEIKTTSIQNIDVQKEVHIEVDGIKIKLSEKDLALAKSFKLNKKEYARYKYIMTYTPRAYWTPNIDPIIALGAESNTKEERIHYAKLALELKNERERKELAFARVAIQVEKDNIPNANRWKNPNEIKRGFSSQLNGNKLSIASLFLNATQCEENNVCLKFVSNMVKTNTPTNKLDFYFIDNTDKEITNFAMQNGITSTKIKNGSITLNHEQGELIKNNLTGKKLPFLIHRDNSGTRLELAE